MADPSERAVLILITPLAAASPLAIEALLDRAFGADRHGRTAYRLRAGMRPLAALSFAAFDGADLVGTLQSWPVALTDAGAAITELALVGPVAVLPDRQRDGIGRRLMQAALDAADSLGHDALVLIGDPEYYGRFFGFDAGATGGWTLPGPVERHRLLVRLTGGRTLPEHAALGPRAFAPQPGIA